MNILKLACAAALVCSFTLPAEAAKKKNNNYTPTAQQRKQAYENGLKSCRKKFGAQLHFVRVEKYYGKWSAVCYHY